MWIMFGAAGISLIIAAVVAIHGRKRKRKKGPVKWGGIIDNYHSGGIIPIPDRPISMDEARDKIGTSLESQLGYDRLFCESLNRYLKKINDDATALYGEPISLDNPNKPYDNPMKISQDEDEIFD